MPAALSLPLQTLYAELLERCGVADLTRDFPAGGGFVTHRNRGRIYWYFQERLPEGSRRQRYVGPDSPALRSQIEAHRAAKDDLSERRQLVSALKRAGLPAPDRLTGRVLEALAEAGAFRLRAIVVGTVAYQTYSGLLGTRLSGATTMTGDLDLAQFESVAVSVRDRLAVPLQTVLQRVDPGFRAVGSASDPRRSTRFALGTGYRVDLLTPNRGPERRAPVSLPALGADAEPLRFLDFLIREEVPAVVLHRGGVRVNVPAPERFAIHKLILSRLRIETRDAQAKAGKDLVQAGTLMRVLAKDRPDELKRAWEEMWARGARWRSHAATAASRLDEAAHAALQRVVGRIEPVAGSATT